MRVEGDLFNKTADERGEFTAENVNDRLVDMISRADSVKLDHRGSKEDTGLFLERDTEGYNNRLAHCYHSLGGSYYSPGGRMERTEIAIPMGDEPDWIVRKQVSTGDNSVEILEVRGSAEGVINGHFFIPEGNSTVASTLKPLEPAHIQATIKTVLDNLDEALTQREQGPLPPQPTYVDYAVADVLGGDFQPEQFIERDIRVI